MNNKIIVGSAIHVACWIIGYWTITSIMFDSSCKDVYGIIVGWWLALYVGFILKIGIEVFLPTFLFCIFMSIASFIIGETGWFYHDAPEHIDFLLLVVIFLQALVFASPIAVNWLVRKYSA